MKLENQVCTLEQAKRLKELGVKDANYFDWYLIETIVNNEQYTMVSYSNPVNHKMEKFLGSYPAYTVAELGEMLPETCESNKVANQCVCFKWACYYLKSNSSYHKEYGDTEAEARAAMLIYLLENNLITAEEVNARLTA